MTKRNSSGLRNAGTIATVAALTLDRKSVV